MVLSGRTARCKQHISSSSGYCNHPDSAAAADKTRPDKQTTIKK